MLPLAVVRSFYYSTWFFFFLTQFKLTFSGLALVWSKARLTSEIQPDTVVHIRILYKMPNSCSVKPEWDLTCDLLKNADSTTVTLL